jgi:mono/diheme cytochrome c family protein
LAIVLAVLLVLGIGAAQDDFDWQRLGEQTYMVNCVACHQANGEGIPGSFPPLAGHVPEILAQEGGRPFLAHVLAVGFAGPIEVGGSTYDGSMPGWPQLDDERLAAVLNHIATAWDNEAALPSGFEIYTPAEVAELRAADLSTEDVYRERYEIGLAQPAPPEAPGGASGGTAVEADEVDPSAVVYDDENGYFTADQAARGEDLYAEHCAICHGPSMRGGVHEPGLTNLGFFRHWEGQSMTAFYNYVKSTMPIGNPGRLRNSEYLAIMAYWLDYHEYPAGETPLLGEPQATDQITIENR